MDKHIAHNLIPHMKKVAAKVLASEGRLRTPKPADMSDGDHVMGRMIEELILEENACELARLVLTLKE